MQALSFSFENTAVRTLGTPETPLFVTIDVCTALGYKRHRDAVAQHVDPEDLIKAEVETKGGVQTLNCVNESGLYALIFGSKLESAKRFKKWVTSEVLPAIRRTGRYECPVATTLTIDAAQQLAVKKAVARRAKNVAVHYQTIYHALYDRFQVPRYTELLRSEFDDAIRFIETCEIRPQIETAPSIPEDAVVLTREEAQVFLSVAYVVKYLFRPQYKLFAQFLNAVHSPMTGAFWDAFNDMSISFMANSLARHGLRIEDLDCYKHFASRAHAAR